MSERMMYRHKIKKAILELEAKANGRTKYRDRISFTFGKGKVSVLIVDRGGIKEGWTEKRYPYTKATVDLIKKIILG